METEEAKEMLEAQLSELELLRSMFPGKGEVRADEAATVAFLSGPDDGGPPPTLRISVSLELGGLGRAELSADLPPAYPKARPDLMLRADGPSARELNRRLIEHLNGVEAGDPCLFEAISWLQENAPRESEPTLLAPGPPPAPSGRSRLWIYSHHVYSTAKRKDIVSLADDFGLTGFLLAGKPGVVCVEGDADDCDRWWAAIKAMNWKKILVRKREDFPPLDDFARKFSDFREISFQSTNGRGNDKHMDMGEFYKYLNDHQCSYIFVDYFGVDGRTSQ